MYTGQSDNNSSYKVDHSKGPSYQGLNLHFFDVLCHLRGSLLVFFFGEAKGFQGDSPLLAAFHFGLSAWFFLASDINVFCC